MSYHDVREIQLYMDTLDVLPARKEKKKKSCYPHKFTEYKHRIWFIPNDFPLNHSEHNVDL